MPNKTEPWLLDTHIWIRLVNGESNLSLPAFLSGIRQRESSGQLLLATISLWETAMLVSKGRLSLTLPVRDWLEKATRMPGLSVIQLDAEIAADSCFLPGGFHGDPADRLIAATARSRDATLITFDQALLDYGKEGWIRARAPGDCIQAP
ncbi:MAG: type II toxin-antitoxin system VapC family toxin [Spirochaetota bacterium]